jgi:hypothetical protein
MKVENLSYGVTELEIEQQLGQTKHEANQKYKVENLSGGVAELEIEQLGQTKHEANQKYKVENLSVGGTEWRTEEEPWQTRHDTSQKQIKNGKLFCMNTSLIYCIKNVHINITTVLAPCCLVL